MTDTEEQLGELWPDNMKMGDTVEFRGHKYEVVGTGPGKAQIECVDDENVTGEIFRWAFTNEVGVELEVGFSQSEFSERVQDEQRQ
jgi:hypothetical protein